MSRASSYMQRRIRAGRVRSARNARSGQMRDPIPLTRAISLRWRVTLLAAVVVGIAVAVMALAAYAVVLRALYADVDSQLRTRAESLASLARSGGFEDDAQSLFIGTMYSTNISVALVLENGQAYQIGVVPVGSSEREVIAGKEDLSLRTTENQRVLARKLDDGSVLILSQSLAPTDAVLDRLAGVLGVVGICGVVLAAVAGTTVARAGMRPVARLTQAAERIARTDDLRPIPVQGNDELARLTESFNMMLRALDESRERQSRLVADAGHELRTPLTSLRTNMELLIASSAPGAAPVPEQDMADLRHDVMAQIEELSTLVGDLVDLAREDAPQVVHEQVDLVDLVDRSLERVRRRRMDVDFSVTMTPWVVYGDAAGLSRAVLNILDNAAKWSPPNSPVVVRLEQTEPFRAVLTVADSGPGIAPEERKLVFDRFYRATASRSMPGSGLGLAIVKQMVVKHGGAVWADESPTGGAQITVVLPGAPTAGAHIAQEQAVER